MFPVCRRKALVRIQNKETSCASTSNVSDLLTAHDFSWLVQAMEQLGIARQVSMAVGVARPCGRASCICGCPGWQCACTVTGLHSRMGLLP